MKYKILVFAIGLIVPLGFANSQLTFKTLLEQSLVADPQIEALELKINSKEHSVSNQNGYSPTQFSLETTNLGAEEYSLLVGQEFQMSNQRGKIQNTLRAEKEALKAEINVRKSQVEFDLGVLYLEAVSFQDHILYLDSLSSMMNESASWIRKTIELGNGSKLDLIRINLDIKEVLFQKSKYTAHFEAKLKQINSFASAQVATQTKLGFSLEDLSLEPISNSKGQGVSPSELVLRKQALAEMSKAKEAEIGYFPNLFLEGGMTQNVAEGGFYGQLNLGLSIPLFSNNSDAIRAQYTWAKAAQKEADFVKHQNRIGELELVSKINQTQTEIRYIKLEMLKDAQAVLKEMNRLLSQGVFSFLDYQMSRRELLQLKQQEFKLLEELGKSQLKLKHMTGATSHVFN